MNNILFRTLVLTILSLFIQSASNAQIRDVIVERYYVADSLDATDTTQGISVEPGAVTYRVYLQLEPGSRVLSVYGDQNHPLVISSTLPFYNCDYQPGAYFGYQLNKNLFLIKPTLALDSYLTLGLAAKNQSGVLKVQDTDGNFFAGPNNAGGSSGIIGGILNNADPSAGTPLTTSDGLMLYPASLSTWLDNGFRDITGLDTTIFGNSSATSFVSTNSFLQQTNGVRGGSPDSTLVLVAQLTTKGEISFKLNVELLTNNGSGPTVKYVSNSDTLLNGEVVEPLLTYPQACGCTDPSYLEYDAVYGCLEADSCKNKVRFGCLDSAACNFDPDANFSVPEMCCYPGLCQDRDLSVVCPQLNNLRETIVNDLYPNPANDKLLVPIHPGMNGVFVEYNIEDVYGKRLFGKTTGSLSGDYFADELDITSLPAGSYLLTIITDGIKQTRKFIVAR